MIVKEWHPLGWAALMYELEDAHEHLGQLIAEMESDPNFGEADFRVGIGHIYSHLNRAWRRRATEGAIPETERHSASQFPDDMGPL